MALTPRLPLRAAVVLAALAIAAAAHAQGRTDVVSLRNGDRITGEVVSLERGRLEFKTDDAGTLYLEWDKLASVVAMRQVEVVTADGRRFLGVLGDAPSRFLSVAGPDGPVPLAMSDVVLIRTIGGNFWRKLDGSVDSGFSYTRSSGIAQLNLNTDTIYGKPASRARLTASLTATRTDDDREARDDRGTLEASYLRYPWQEVFIVAAGRFETNESLGLVLRSQIGGAVGRRLVNSNRGQFAFGAGLALNNEQGVDVEPTENIEGLLLVTGSFYTYDRPRTNLDLTLQYYPSLSNTGRHRIQLDAGLKREFWRDLFLSISIYNSFDNRPPNPSADTNDVGVVLSLGWTY